jgi:phage terminase Nu1 subunit (DNA packaging protein)
MVSIEKLAELVEVPLATVTQWVNIIASDQGHEAAYKPDGSLTHLALIAVSLESEHYKEAMSC